MSRHAHTRTSHITRRTAVRASFGLAAGFTFSGRISPATHAQYPIELTLALDWYPNANHAGFYLAQERGYFEDAGLAVEIYTPADPAAALQTVGAGRDTFGISYHSEILFAREQGVPVVSIAALVQHPLNCLMMLEASDIERPSDLVGRSVGMAGLPSDDAMLGAMLESDGASLDDIDIVTVGFNLLPALFSGRVDAVIGVTRAHEPMLAEQQGYPVRYLPVEDWGVPDYYELILAAGESTISNHGDVIRSFLGAMQLGYRDAAADPDEVLNVLLAANPELDIEIERRGLDMLVDWWTSGGVPFGDQTTEKWDAFGGWMKDQGLLDEDVDIAGAWNGDLLPSSGTSATPSATPEN